VLISALTELCQTGWKLGINIFRSGYTNVLGRELKSKLPGCNLKASPHIESRLKILKKRCDAITDMKDASGIEWRTTDRTLISYDDDEWGDWVKNIEDASDAYRPLDIYETSDSKASENNESAHEEANGHKRNGMAAGNSHDDDDVGTKISTQAANEKGRSRSSGMEGLVHIIEVLLEKQEEQFSVLNGLVGREVEANKAAADRRGRLNGELKRIPKLALKERL
ncbi:hypothetical protein Tco_1088371, partial [Tanacetum coccineum]